MVGLCSYRRPFTPDDYFGVPLVLLARVGNALELDALDLLLYMVTPGGDEAAFPDHRSIAWWVRTNTERLPNLMSHVTFDRILEEWQRTVDGVPLLQRTTACKECFRVILPVRGALHAGASDVRVFYKPRVYLDLRWPAWFGRSGWAQREVLLAFFAAMTEQTEGHAAQPVEPEATMRQVRAWSDNNRHITGRLPGAGSSGTRFSAALLHLARLRLITEVRRSTHGATYRLNLKALAQRPTYSTSAVAAICGLNPDRDANWITLIVAFLEANCHPQEESTAVWRELRPYSQLVAAEEDVSAVLRLLEKRRGRASTTVRRVLRDYHTMRGGIGSWLTSAAVTLYTTPYGVYVSDESALPQPAPDTMLDAVQLSIRLVPEGRTARYAVADSLTGATLSVWQDEKAPFVAGPLVLQEADVKEALVFNCSHLLKQLNWSRPIRLLLHHNATGESVRLDCRFRIRIGV